MRAVPALALALSLAVLAACEGDSTGSNRGPVAASYINPDLGAATANPDVAANSECETPDQEDTQRLSDAGAANRNVHNDACLFTDRAMTTKLDGPATFESSGAGFISACPDPDAAGAKTATLTDTNGDGRNDRCTQGGFQARGIDGDGEFHARLNNNTTAGLQTVVFCSDANLNGCADESVKQTIRITWTQ